MKTTFTMRNTANPRRTTLAHLQDADEWGADEPATRAAAEEQEAQGLAGRQGGLPAQIANPDRVVFQNFEDAATRIPELSPSSLDG